MNKTINLLLVLSVIVPIVLLLWPFALWNDPLSLILRIIPALAGQVLLCRIGKSGFVRTIPLLLTGAMAMWGTYLYVTSPNWSNATFGGSLIADYASPFICCAIVFCLALLIKKK